MLSLRSFHHEAISRLQAEDLLLKAAGKDGSFLVRDSETVPGAFTLCLLHKNRVHQYRILPDTDGKIFVQAERGVVERKFCGLLQLVHEYIQRGDRNGLVCALQFPVSFDDDHDKETGCNSSGVISYATNENKDLPSPPPPQVKIKQKTGDAQVSRAVSVRSKQERTSVIGTRGSVLGPAWSTTGKSALDVEPQAATGNDSDSVVKSSSDRNTLDFVPPCNNEETNSGGVLTLDDKNNPPTGTVMADKENTGAHCDGITPSKSSTDDKRDKVDAGKHPASSSDVGLSSSPAEVSQAAVSMANTKANASAKDACDGKSTSDVHYENTRITVSDDKTTTVSVGNTGGKSSGDSSCAGDSLDKSSETCSGVLGSRSEGSIATPGASRTKLHCAESLPLDLPSIRRNTRSCSPQEQHKDPPKAVVRRSNISRANSNRRRGVVSVDDMLYQSIDKYSKPGAPKDTAATMRAPSPTYATVANTDKSGSDPLLSQIKETPVPSNISNHGNQSITRTHEETPTNRRTTEGCSDKMPRNSPSRTGRSRTSKTERKSPSRTNVPTGTTPKYASNVSRAAKALTSGAALVNGSPITPGVGRAVHSAAESIQSSHSSPEKDDETLADADYSSVTRHFLQRFSQLDLSSCDGDFLNMLRQYVEVGIHQDTQVVTTGGKNLKHLRQLLAAASKKMEREMEEYLCKIDMCRQLFGPLTTQPLVPNNTLKAGQQVGGCVGDLEALNDRLNVCRTAALNLEKKAVNKLQDLMAYDVDNGAPEAPPRTPLLPAGARPKLPPTCFEAKLNKPGKLAQKLTLTVDIQGGKLFMVKPSKDHILDDSNVFTHEKIMQLVKSTSNNCRLEVHILGRKKETVVFEASRQREHFCQLVQQLKATHSLHHEVDRLAVFVGTWNMADESPPYDLTNWLKGQGQGKTRNPTLSMIPHDLYVIGTQESALPEKEWVNRLKLLLQNAFDVQMYTVGVVNLWGIRLVVLVKAEFKTKITHIQQSNVRTGIANALGNKGAVGLSFHFNGTSFCFICGHLTSGHERNSRRHQNVRDIIKGLSLGSKKLSMFDVTNQFHHVFFFGDLNYRVEELESVEIIKMVTQDNNITTPLRHDQLRRALQDNTVFFGFKEEEITFPPTYRYARGSTDKYEWQKFKKTGLRVNAPSWCDRILWKSYPETYIFNTAYGVVDSICSSDHKPVFASYDIGVTSQFASGSVVPSKPSETPDLVVVFEEVQAEVRTSTKEFFKLEMHSSCLEGPVLSKQNCLFKEASEGVCAPHWSVAHVPQLQPIVADRDYLEDQHVLVAVKTADGMESYGECVLALKSMFAFRPQKFVCALTHLGEKTGLLRGQMHVKSRDGAFMKNKPRGRRSYELIYMDTDQLRLEMEFHKQQQQGAVSPQARIDPRMLSTTTSPSTSDFMGESPPVSMCSPSSPSPDANALYSSPVSQPESLIRKSQTLQSEISRLQDEDLGPPLHSSGLTGIKTTKSQMNLSEVSKEGWESPLSIRRTPGATAAQSRLPRLGQSSLAQNNVLPIVTASATSPDVCSDDYAEIMTPPADGGSAAEGITQSDVNRSQEVHKHAGRKSPSSVEVAMDNRPQEEEQVLVQSAAGKRVSNISNASDISIPPPPMPPRRYRIHSEDSSDAEYAALRPPESVKDWLLSLGLPQYIIKFLQSGWDNMSFISEVDDHDLDSMGVGDPEHKDRILKSITGMRYRASTEL